MTDNISENIKKHKQYNSTFYEKNHERIHETVSCSLCKGEYTYYNKSRHMKTKKHQFEELKIKLSQAIE